MEEIRRYRPRSNASPNSSLAAGDASVEGFSWEFRMQYAPRGESAVLT
jgi:hypothetical protein